jgi:hypothetical protein
MLLRLLPEDGGGVVHFTLAHEKTKKRDSECLYNTFF